MRGTGDPVPRAGLRNPPGSRTAARSEWDAARQSPRCTRTHYRSLVRLAALLVRDVATAEEIVQDSFIAMHTAWRRTAGQREGAVLPAPVGSEPVTFGAAAPGGGGQERAQAAADMPAAEQGALTLLERTAVMALRSLPPRQREALVLRYYGDLSEAQIAAAMGISRGAVRSHTARAIASLRAVLEMEC